jgi:hypothetical protein
VLLAWLLFQAILGMRGFYQPTGDRIPGFLFLILPPLVFIALTFFTIPGRRYIAQMDIRWLTMIHVIRIPVELVLLWLCMHKGVPQIMTFEGRNFDILAGATAPFVYYFGLVRKKIPVKIILAWNIICLCLLMNIVILAILYVKLSFQQIGFDQPDIAILYFPFIWLPCFLVPMVLYAHLAAILQLLNKMRLVLPGKRKTI